MNLLNNKKFYPTFWVQLFGALNNNILKNAFVMMLTFNVVGMNNSNYIVLAGALFILPFFMFSALAGDIADKYPKQILTQNLKKLELVITCIGAIGFIINAPFVLFTCIFLMGTQAAFYGPIKYSIVPELLEENQLVKANALIEMGTFLSILLGTICGGVLIGLNGGEYIVSVTCLSLATLGLFFSKKIPELYPINKNVKISLNLIKTNKKNFNLVKHQKNILLTVLGISWFWLLGAILLSMFPVLVKEFLHGQESLVTLLLSIFCVGIAVGSVVCEKMSKNYLELGLVPIGSIGMFWALIDLYFSLKGYSYNGAALSIQEFVQQASSIRILVDLFVFSIFAGIYNVPLYSYLQIRTKREERSQIISANNIMNAFFMVMGSILLSSLFYFKVSFPVIILTLAGLSFAVATYIYFFMPEFLWRLACLVLTKVIYSFEIKGLKTIPHDKSIVLVSNHVSFVDWLLIAAAVNRPVHFVMDHKIYNNILLKFIFKSVNAIPIAPQKVNETIYNESFQEIKRTLASQELVCIFPEGKITQDGNLNTYKSGIDRIMKDNPGIDVQPLVIKGLYGSFFSRANKGRAFSNPLLLLTNFRKKVQIEFLETVNHQEVSAKRLEEITLESFGNSVDPKPVLENV